jgi:acyl carrier protein
MLTREELTLMLRGHVADLLDMKPEEIDPERNLGEYGLDSADAVLLAGAVEEAINHECDPAILLRNPAISGVIAELVSASLVA